MYLNATPFGRSALAAMALVACAKGAPPAVPGGDAPVVAIAEPRPPSPVSKPQPGGLRLIYGVTPPEATQAMASAMRKRLDVLGPEAADVTATASGEVKVEFRRAVDAEAMADLRHTIERPGRLAITRCKDEADPIGDHLTARLPVGLVIAEENVPNGVGQRRTRHYASMYARDGETDEDAAERLEAWLADKSKRHRLRIGPLRRPESRGFRTYTLVDGDDLDTDLVAEVAVEDDRIGGGSVLRVRFTPFATTAFAELTKANLGRRLAIVLDDRVLSAPVVMDAISGGEVLVTLGHDVTRAEAERLARLVAVGPLPGRLELRVEELIGPSTSN